MKDAPRTPKRPATDTSLDAIAEKVRATGAAVETYYGVR